jgi:hypothetical protein
MYTRPVVATVLAVLVALFFAAFMYSAHGPQSGETLAIFEFIPAGLILDLGIAVMLGVVAAGCHIARWRGGSGSRGGRLARRARQPGRARAIGPGGVVRHRA